MRRWLPLGPDLPESFHVAPSQPICTSPATYLPTISHILDEDILAQSYVQVDGSVKSKRIEEGHARLWNCQLHFVASKIA